MLLQRSKLATLSNFTLFFRIIDNFNESASSCAFIEQSRLRPTYYKTGNPYPQLKSYYPNRAVFGRET